MLTDENVGYLPENVPCLVRDLPESTYHGSKSVLTSTRARKLITHTPAHLDHDMHNPRDTAAFAFGRLVHCMALRPDDVNKEFALWNPPCDATGKILDRRTKAGKEAYANFQATLGSRTDVKQDVWLAAEAASRSVVKTLNGIGYADDAIIEASVYAILDDVLCAARPDIVLQQKTTGMVTLIDIKTTDDLNEYAFRRSFRKYGYAYQLQHYKECLDHLGYEVDEVLIVAVEKNPPHLARTFRVPIYALEDCELDLIDARRKWKRCIEEDDWHAWPDMPCELELI